MKYLPILFTILFSSLFLISQNAYADIYIWTGNGGNTNWSDPNNWECEDVDGNLFDPCGNAPLTLFEATEDVAIVSSATVTMDVDVTLESVTAIEIDDDFGSPATVTNNAILTTGVSAVLDVTRSTFINLGTVTHNGGSTIFGNPGKPALFDNDNLLENFGKISISPASTMDNSGTVDNTSGEIIINGQFINIGIFCGGTLSGIGSIPPPNGYQLNCTTNNSPVANNDQYSVNENSVDNILDVATNDSDSDGTLDLSTVAVTSGPTDGVVVSIDAVTGDIIYSPDPDFFGFDSLTYTIADDLGATSNAATVTIEVTEDTDDDGVPDEVEDALTGGGGLNVATGGGISNTSFELEPTGEITIEATGGSGEPLVTIELPAGSMSSSGGVTIVHQTVGPGITVALITGIDTVPYPPGKTLSFTASTPTSDHVCFIDRTAGVATISFPFNFCPENISNSIVRMDCSDTGITRTISGFPDAPTTRDYTCKTIDDLSIPQRFLEVSGLAFSTVNEFEDEDGDNLNDVCLNGFEEECGIEIIDSDVNDNLKVKKDEIVVIRGATIDGNIKNNGGTVIIREDSTIKGNIVSKNGGTVIILDSTVDGNIKGDNGASITIDNGNVNGHVRCGCTDLTITNDSTINKNVNSKNAVSVSITDNPESFNGHVRVEGATSVVISNNSVDKNLRVKTSGQVTITDNIVGGHLRSLDNGQTTITGNDVTGNLRVKDSSGVAVEQNEVGKNLRVIENNGVSVIENIVDKNLNIKENTKCTHSGNVVAGKEKIKDCKAE